MEWIVTKIGLTECFPLLLFPNPKNLLFFCPQLDFGVIMYIFIYSKWLVYFSDQKTQACLFLFRHLNSDMVMSFIGKVQQTAQGSISSA